MGGSRAFGGCQLVLFGDFYQLPPVDCTSRRLREAGHGGFCPHLFLNRGFAFQSMAWARSNLKLYTVSAVYRQRQDAEFVRILNAVREGQLSALGIRILYLSP